MLTITAYQDERTLARTVAAQIASALRAAPGLVLGLPTGRTPIRLYHELGRLHQSGAADFSGVTTFNLDEFLGIPPEHPGSYRSFMQEHFFSRVNIPPGRIHLLNGTAPDPDAECRRYESAIEEAGGIDLQILGIGTNGHIGFNEPARELIARTHRVRLKASTRRSNAALFGGDPEQVPREALSMGMGSILQARRILLMATGKAKARCVAGAATGPITTKLPASFLQLHPAVEFAVDRAAMADAPAGGGGQIPSS